MYGEKTRDFILNNFTRENFEDKKFLMALRNVIVRETNTEKFVKKIVSADLSLENTSALYDYGEKTISFDMRILRESIKSLKRRGIISVINSQCIASQFYQAIIHENTHAFQDTLAMDDANKTPFVEALRDSVLVHDGHFDLHRSGSVSKKSRIKADKFYNLHHDLFPGERHADMVAYDFVLSICLELFPDDINLITDFKYLYSKMLRNGYGIDTCPMKEFYKLLKHEDKFKSYDFSDYNVNERLIYGMSLTNQELHDENKRVLEL